MTFASDPHVLEHSVVDLLSVEDLPELVVHSTSKIMQRSCVAELGEYCKVCQDVDNHMVVCAMQKCHK